MWHNNTDGFEKINTLGKQRTPFLFIISYDKNKIFAEPLEALDKDIFYTLKTWGNTRTKTSKKTANVAHSPIDFAKYQASLDKVLKEIRSGNTYLLNLTFKTPITTDVTLKEIFTYAQADFKLYYKNEFVCFSPECFIEIEKNTIATYPMKGTIDATVKDAKATILADSKEMAEHVMIVDLMRNDLGMVANDIKVNKFRYVQKIQAGDKELLQISSKITATLPTTWKDTLGTLLNQLLPAGSITGAPKKSTIEIIKNIEDFERGFYTGVFGVFDGQTLRSAVMIRFIEKENQQLYYKSGGGITIDSKAQSEYKELIDKIYVPM